MQESSTKSAVFLFHNFLLDLGPWAPNVFNLFFHLRFKLLHEVVGEAPPTVGFDDAGHGVDEEVPLSGPVPPTAVVAEPDIPPISLIQHMAQLGRDVPQLHLQGSALALQLVNAVEDEDHILGQLLAEKVLELLVGRVLLVREALVATKSHDDRVRSRGHGGDALDDLALNLIPASVSVAHTWRVSHLQPRS